MSTHPVCEQYNRYGVLARKFEEKSFEFEAGSDAAKRTSAVTFIGRKIPIRLFRDHSFGLLYDPKLVEIRGAFKSDIYSWELDLSRDIPFFQRDGKE